MGGVFLGGDLFGGFPDVIWGVFWECLLEVFFGVLGDCQNVILGRFPGCHFWGVSRNVILGDSRDVIWGYSGNDILLVSCQNCQFPVIESASVYEVFLFL